MASNLELLMGALGYIQGEIKKYGGTAGAAKTRINPQKSIISQQIGHGGADIVAHLNQHERGCEMSITALQQAEEALKKKIAALQAAARAR
jgi:hypothetical protein